MQCRLFAYGTLMFPEIASLVTGERPPRQDARLDDHARHALRDRPCPGAVPRGGASIPGTLLHRLPPGALSRIDAFEGERYRRVSVNVRADDGDEYPALVYLLRPRWHPLLLPHDWCHESFQRQWHARYVRRLSAEFADASAGATAARTR